MSKPVFYCILAALSGILARFGMIQLHHKEFKLFLLLFVLVVAAFLWALCRFERRHPTFDREEDQFSGGITDA